LKAQQGPENARGLLRLFLFASLEKVTWQPSTYRFKEDKALISTARNMPNKSFFGPFEGGRDEVVL
jgi:hypothetical protein